MSSSLSLFFEWDGPLIPCGSACSGPLIELPIGLCVCVCEFCFVVPAQKVKSLKMRIVLHKEPVERKFITYGSNTPLIIVTLLFFVAIIGSYLLALYTGS